EDPVDRTEDPVRRTEDPGHPAERPDQGAEAPRQGPPLPADGRAGRARPCGRPDGAPPRLTGPGDAVPSSSMGIPDEDVARVRAATDIVALIGEHAALKRQG